MNETINILYMIIFILLTLNCCIRIKILDKLKAHRLESHKKQWSQIELNEYNLTRRF